MTKHQTGLAVQGGGILLGGISLVHMITAQPLMAIGLIGALVTFVVGHFMKNAG